MVGYFKHSNESLGANKMFFALYALLTIRIRTVNAGFPFMVIILITLKTIYSHIHTLLQEIIHFMYVCISVYILTVHVTCTRYTNF
jgi:hypothetical protein